MKPWRYATLNSLRFSLTLIVLATGVPLLLVTLVSGFHQRQKELTQAKLTLSRLAESVAILEESSVNNIRRTLESLAAYPEVKRMDGRACETIFRKIRELSARHLNIALFDIAGDLVASAIPSKKYNVSDRKNFTNTIQREKFTVGGYTISRTVAIPSLPFMIPIFNDHGRINGVLVLAVTLESFSDLFGKTTLPEGSFIGLTDNAGFRLFRHPPQENHPPGELVPARMRNAASAIRKDGFFSEKGADGVKRVYALRKMKLTPDEPSYLNIFVGIPESYILSKADAVTARYLLIVAISLLFAASLAWFIGREVYRRVSKLVNVAHLLGAGDLSARTGNTNPKGGLGKLSTALDNMAISLERDDIRRINSEKALRRSESKFRHILERVPLIGISLDPRGHLTFANDHFLKLTGWNREEALGRNWFDTFIPPEIREEIRTVFTSTMSAKTTWDFSSNENDILTRDGHRLNVAWANVLTKDADATVLDVTCLGVDLTERERAEKSLLKARDAAEAANRAKGEFLANMSHELRTPLNGVLGMLQLLDNSSNIADDDKVLLETAMESGRGLLAIINDILSFSQLDAGKLTIAQDPVNLREIVDSLSRTFLYEVQEKQLSLVASIDDGVPDTVLSDAGRIRQILLNLITNALKFTNDGQVEIAATMLPHYPSPSDRRILITVSDTGIGIPDDKIEYIFEPFTQVDGSLTRKYKGTGIGLGIVRQLVHLMGGSICIDSTTGAGTTFYVTIQCKWSLLKPTAATMAQAETSRIRHGFRVLVAEDDRVNLFTATRFLERLGCLATGANDGREAMTLLAAEHFDCILMDVQMPVMDGVEATKAIRASQELGAKARTPIIAMTAHAMPGDREQFLAAGMDGYISKPVDMDELERILSGIVEKHHAEH